MSSHVSCRATASTSTDSDIRANLAGTPLKYKPVVFRVPNAPQRVFLGANARSCDEITNPSPVNLLSAFNNADDWNTLMMSVPDESDGAERD